MNWCSSNELRRCRPLLGTFVEIAVESPIARHSSLRSSRPDQVSAEEATIAAEAAISAAFAVIERLHQRFSAHDPASELSQLNREATKRAVRVSPETFDVLRCAILLAEESEGAFDPTIAPELADWGLLPADLRRRNPGSWRDVILEPSCRVRFRRPLALDFGGIAKGYAVDSAIESLRAHGIRSALVNAGGDLRCIGRRRPRVHLRHPTTLQLLLRPVALMHEAMATSSPCFTECARHGRRISHLVNRPAGGAVTGGVSATVFASECWLADALAKIVLIAPHLAELLLKKYQAEALIVSA